jgi:hypothetical protein
MPNKASSRSTVAILGSGIMGSSVALYLARNNIRVVLIDASSHPFMGASRWNEGKIHLGYLYGADPTLNTARKLIPGGLNFPILVKELVDHDLNYGKVTSNNDRYLIHRNSVANPDDAFALAKKISKLTQEHPDAENYFVSPHEITPQLLSDVELNNQYNTEEIVLGFEVPERSVSTQHIADYYVSALSACDQIECAMGQRVLAVKKLDRKHNSWSIQSINSSGDAESFGPFDAVVNALWEGRRAIDATVGLEGPDIWTNRYRVSVFAKTKRPVNLNSAVISVGPFGDVKNYDDRNLYLSWYDTGLLITSQSLLPPCILEPDEKEELLIVKTKLRNLGAIIPSVGNLLEEFESFQLHGGWVYAAGEGELSEPKSELHKRDRIGLFSKEGYFSIDTGKYSIAPWLAQKVANAVIETIR